MGDPGKRLRRTTESRSVCVYSTVCSGCFYELWYEQWPPSGMVVVVIEVELIRAERKVLGSCVCVLARRLLDRFVIREIEILKIVAGREKAKEEEREIAGDIYYSRTDEDEALMN
jgi:hypothetical protein